MGARKMIFQRASCTSTSHIFTYVSLRTYTRKVPSIFCRSLPKRLNGDAQGEALSSVPTLLGGEISEVEERTRADQIGRNRNGQRSARSLLNEIRLPRWFRFVGERYLTALPVGLLWIRDTSRELLPGPPYNASSAESMLFPLAASDRSTKRNSLAWCRVVPTTSFAFEYFERSLNWGSRSETRDEARSRSSSRELLEAFPRLENLCIIIRHSM